MKSEQKYINHFAKINSGVGNKYTCIMMNMLAAKFCKYLKYSNHKMYKNCQEFIQGGSGKFDRANINKLIPCQKPNFESENRTLNPKMFGPALEYL